MASVFCELLGQLAAEHERVLQSNAGLEAENAALRGTSPPRQQKLEEQQKDASGVTAPKLSEVVCCGTSSAVAYKDEIIVASECAVLTEEQILSRSASQVRNPIIPRSPPPWQPEGPVGSSIVKLAEQQGTATSERLLDSRDRLKMSISRYLTEPDLGRMDADYMLWPVWNEDAPFDLGRFSEMSRSSAMMQVQLSSLRGGDFAREDNCLQPLVTSPSSQRRVIWDLISVLVVGWDVLTVPLIAFKDLENKAFEGIGLFTTIFWTMDIPFSFLSGFYKGGLIEMRPSQIAAYYVRHWFALDISIILTDWILLFLQSGLTDVIGIVRISKTLRLSRILRLLRLLRVMKVPAILDDLVSNLESDGLMTALGVFRSLALIGVVNHFIACGWYAAGTFTEEGEYSWLATLNKEDRDTAYRYFTSLHWSLTQFTPASMEVVPLNTVERVYAISVVTMAMVTFSTFVSSITTSMTSLRRTNAERSKHRENLRKYITDNQISIVLAGKISAFFRSHSLKSKKRVHEDDVQAFKVLPDSLRMQLHWEVYSFRLTPHPLFHHYGEVEQHGMFELCHRAMSEEHVGTCQDLFALGGKATKVYVLLSGLLEYYLSSCESGTVEVGEGSYICEVVLWVQWLHRGRLSAMTSCEFVVLDASRFRKVTSRLPSVLGACKDYAKSYREKVVALGADHPTDLYYDFDKSQEMAQNAFGKQDVVFEPPKSKLRKLWRSWSPARFLQRASDEAVEPDESKMKRSNTY
mmetsp:Transcript_112505/g.223595  ORF Transcript_112505/g.223595 Transcript_112505/m.223595 type:complete len:749 (+) Transcript_112505:130-2376(+)